MVAPEQQGKDMLAPPVPEWLKTYLLERYQNSSYANFLQMHPLEIRAGDITLSMFVRPELTNLRKILHGGAVGSLLDMAMNLACFSTGRHATVLGFNTNFLRGCKEGKTVRAKARMLHDGRRTMVVEGRILDQEEKLLAKGRGTFLARDRYSPENLMAMAAPRPAGQEARGAGISPPRLPQARGNPPGWLKEALMAGQANNYFARYLGMEIGQLGEGNCLVDMPVTHRHINVRRVVHGGALVSLADMSMMLACATLAKQTVTLDLNINFLRRVGEAPRITSLPEVVHKGKSTMVVRTSIIDEEEKLLAEARGTFFVTGDYEPQEEIK